ncbi:hypothetical protein AGMMS50293_17130 [Spirochaetia bacterium]|nr:hypothetical protein AGMMS50293_17130 [Spirochaetia bacterium]
MVIDMAQQVKNGLKIPAFWHSRQSQRPKVRILALFLLFLAAIPSLYAGGRKDNSDLAKADVLIQEKKYDAAILILSDVSRRYPNQFDQVQRRLRQIYQIRDDFNATADRLIDTLVNDPENSSEILALTIRLEELEDSSNPQLQAFITRTMELALFNVNRRRLEDILARGRMLIDQGDYQGALLTYAGGMDVYRDEFFAAGYGEIIEDQVIRNVENVNMMVENFPTLSAPLGAAASEMAGAALEPGITSARLTEMYSRMLPAMDQFIGLYRSFYPSVNYFDNQLAVFRSADPLMGDHNYLSFLSRLMHGRAGESVQEGMLGALEGYWNSATGRVDQVIMRHADETYSSGLALVGSRQYSSARDDFERAGSFISFPASLYAKHLELKAGESPRTVQIFDQEVLQEDADKFLKFESMNQAIGYLVQGTDVGRRVEQFNGNEQNSFERWQGGSLGTEAALSQEQIVSDSITTLQNEIEGVLGQANQREAELRNYRDSLEDRGNVDILAYINDAQRVIENLRSQVIDEVRQSAVRYYTIANDDFRRRLMLRQGEFAEGNQLIQGIRREVADGTVIENYPAEGLAVLTRMTEALAVDIVQSNALLSRYNSEGGDILADQRVSSLRGSAQTIMDDLNALQLRGLALSATARNQIAQAEAYRQEGERLVREAQTALGRQNFDIARDRVQRAAERFNNSLAIQESGSLRTSWDTQLVNLGQEINRLENEMVIRDVGNMLTNARNTYYVGNFEQAEDLLVRAQNRWHVTNSEDEPEVRYWLGIVRNALSIRSGRVILPTAPLYPEMSQLLSEAKRDYEEGVRYINAERRTDGIDKFNEARRKTREVKLMFPVNQEAGILELRMDQVTDPNAFTASFDQRIRDAIAGTKRNSNEAFAELQNLAQINPRYPNLAAIINQAEIDMGFRPPPPDPRALARSAELTASARRIIENNITSQFEVALVQINDALIANPNNAGATRIKQQLLTAMNAPGGIVMSSQDEAEFNRAAIAFQQGNYLVAHSIVERLLQDTRYRNITKLVELQRRIQAVLL